MCVAVGRGRRRRRGLMGDHLHCVTRGETAGLWWLRSYSWPGVRDYEGRGRLRFSYFDDRRMGRRESVMRGNWSALVATHRECADEGR
ncbi:hypothetical protein F511_18871 [Dorcoceras hygrometricum]|uniref:Uncharacterized protein n=1 Tax=Dorcoceras hygrometricum TaxID=472368 RepID=A0A2Z7CBB6_9LAMI|nr:hypothetical protein F511_18871 [Dorcoceras hygrometricum]